MFAIYLQFQIKMPVNLNSLLRYKTIDECLSNPNLKCTIEYLIEKCADKLSEYQGVSSVSERTIRNDIRVLRSDALGYNAPIVVKDGIYSYEKVGFSIFGKSIHELELLKDLQTLLVEEFDNIQNKNLSYLLVELAGITGQKIPRKCAPEDYGIFESKKAGYVPTELDGYKGALNGFIYSLYSINKPYSTFTQLFKKKKKHVYMNWEFILKAL